jgi:hypothetical protein
MKRAVKVLLSLCLLGISTTLTSGADLKSYQGKYAEALKGIHAETVTNLVLRERQYSNALERLREKTQSNGELEEVKSVLAEAKRFNDTKQVSAENTIGSFSVLKKLQTSYMRDIISLRLSETERISTLTKKYDKVLAQLQSDLTKAGKIEEASNILAERNQTKPNITPLTTPVPAEAVPGNANMPEVAQVQNGMLLYYPFKDSPDGKVLDKSGSGHDGTASDVEWKPGRRGGVAAKFNGNGSYIETEVDEALASDADMTISVWVRTQAKAKGWESIAATEAFRIEVCPDGIIHWDWTDKNNIYTEAGVISPDKWTHLAFVRRNRNLAIFVAGTQVFAMQNATSPQSIGTIQFGKSGIANIGGEDFFSGYMDDVRVFTRALPYPEIKALSRE